MAVFGFAEHHAGQERAERERQSAVCVIHAAVSVSNSTDSMKIRAAAPTRFRGTAA